MGVTHLDLKSSVCTDNPTGSDLFPFTPDPTQVVQNTGMERAGGVTAIFEQETTLATSAVSTMIGKDGTIIQIDLSNNIWLDNKIIGNVGPYAIYSRGIIKGYADAAWTSVTTILSIIKVGTTIQVYELDPANNLATLHYRSTNFATLPSTPVSSIALVKYVDMNYSDNLEFIISYPVATIGSTPRQYYLAEASATSSLVPLASSYSPQYVTNCWKFTTGKYLYGTQNLYANFATSGAGAQFQSWATGDLTSTATYVRTPQGAFVKWVVIDRFPGTSYSRAILTFPFERETGGKVIYGAGELGYTSTGTYSATGTYYGVTLATTTATTTIYNPIAGPGYSEGTYSLGGTTTYNMYFPQPLHTATAYVTSTQTGSSMIMGFYGKLTDIYNVTTGAAVGNMVSLRVCMINGVPSYLSAAPLGTGSDCIGVPLTNLGEFDETYIPHVDDNGSTYCRVIYRYDSNLFFVDIRKSGLVLSKVSDNLYTVNCLSAINAISLIDKQLHTGTNDYNGRIIAAYTITSTAPSSYNIVALVQSAYANSFDVGTRLTDQYPTGTPASGTGLDFTFNNFIPGIELPSFIDIKTDFAVVTYSGSSSTTANANLYDISVIGSNGGVKTDPNLIGKTYVPDTRVPIAVGYRFYNRTVQTEIETIITGVGIIGLADIDYDYLGYEIGNDISGQFNSFVLYGQTYVFDGQDIWLVSFIGSLYSGKGNSPVAPATGMTFIAAAPTEVYFLSSFDNSIYTFNGGRALQKIKRLNDQDVISNGVYNVRDNTLFLNATNQFIWIRDGVVTVNSKKSNQTSLSLYDTQNGIQIANNTTKWIYSYQKLSNSTVVPLTWQSAYHALKSNETSELVNWIVTLYSPDGRIAVPVTLTCHSFDQDGYHKQVAQTITINPADWDGLGFVRTRIQPQNRKAIASSVQVYTTKRITITDVSVVYGDEGQAAIAGARSR